jgi:hypothetical protein
MSKHMTESCGGSGLGNLPLPKSQLKSLSHSTCVSLNMSGSEGSGGITVLSAVIPDGIVADATSKIDQDEVRAALSTNPTDQENRVYLGKSRDALELIYDSFKVSGDHSQQLLHELT